MSIVYTPDPAHGRAAPGSMSTHDAWVDRTNLTFGQWATERDAESALDALLEPTGLFEIFRQVEGRPYGNTPTDEVKDYRIDRVIVPTQKARDAGWILGPVGIECKRSGVKIGKPIAQAIDYRRAFWRLDRSPAVWFTLGWVFVWPVVPQGGPLLSVMSQNRVGTAWADEWDGLILGTAGRTLANIRRNGRCEFDPTADLVGRKVGSR